MTFLYPLGLLGLIGIPVIIIIYILKNKFIEQIIPTTYIWTLSEKFLKRRNPFAKLAGIISLILQLLLVAVISFAIALPVFVLPGEARHYAFVIDGSGSMITESEGKSRFEKGKDEIISLIESATDGSTYTLVYVADETSVIFDKVENKEKAVKLMSELAPVDSGVEYTDAIAIAQGYFNDDSSSLVYLVTDKTYETHNNVEVINVEGEENNVSLFDVTVPEGTTQVRGKVVSYAKDLALKVAVYIDDSKTPLHEETLELRAGIVSNFAINTGVPEYYSITVKLLAEDGVAKDNEVVVYNVAKANKYTALVVSDLPFFITSALKAASSSIEITTVDPDEYEGQSGYNLYVFDSYTPYEIPKDGALWLINPTISAPGTGFSVQGKHAEDKAVEIELSKSTNTQVKKLLAGTSGSDIYVTEYVKCGVYDSSFVTLASHSGAPVIFTGANSYGNREVVFAFDIHESNLVGLATDFIAIVRNLIDFSFPKVLEKTNYISGETASVNVVAGCDSIIATSPSGRVIPLALGGTTAELVLTEAGVYKIECMTGGSAKEYFIFSEFPIEERDPHQTALDFSLLGEAGSTGIDGKYDNIAILFILLALIFMSDWVVYCYEKYQLR